MVDSQTRDGVASPVYLLASGDLRLAANQTCWPAQQAMERGLTAAVNRLGFDVRRAHDAGDRGHGFLASQREGIQAFRGVPTEALVIVAEAVWQYSHHVYPGLTTHRGPILTVANWSGQWPGLVGMLNLNGSLTKAGVVHSTLWSEEFSDEYFLSRLAEWLRTGRCTHDCSHARPLDVSKLPAADAELGRSLAESMTRDKAIFGVFDEGCMGMFNAIIPDHLLHACGVFKERLSQSALYYETTQVDESEANLAREWLERQGMRFHVGADHDADLTEDQIRKQCQMYIAAVRLADDFGCDAIGIQYQQGLKDLLPASDLAEGMLNNRSRPPVRDREGDRVLFDGEPLIHFNEADECAGLDALITNRVQTALDLPPETTLHDVRWGDRDQSGSTADYVWVFMISGAAPPAHYVGGWGGAEGFRQPPMYFPNGGSTLRGVSKPGQIIWSRVYVADGQLWMDIGRGHVAELPQEETERRWKATTAQWPIMHGVLHGVTRDQFMAKHQANHIQVVYADDDGSAARSLRVKAAMATSLGINVNLCGDVGM